MATLSVGGTTVFDGSATQGLTSATTFPAYHVIRVLEEKGSSEIICGSSQVEVETLLVPARSAPSVAGNKFIITYSAGGMIDSTSSSSLRLEVTRSIDGGSDATVGNYPRYGYVGGDQNWVPCPVCITTIDSPNTLSSINYKIKCSSTDGNWEVNSASGSSGATLLVMEVVA